MKSYVGYFRVSTDRQGRSGLGLEAQQAAAREFVNSHGQLVAEYTEIETGKRGDRPQLTKALAHSRRQKATLVIPKLDRLARNVAFTAALMESGADFVACDIPEANRLTIHILAAVAEDEAHRISERTKAALKAYRARGGLLGAARPEPSQSVSEFARRYPPPAAGGPESSHADPPRLETRRCTSNKTPQGPPPTNLRSATHSLPRRSSTRADHQIRQPHPATPSPQASERVPLGNVIFAHSE